MVLNCRIWSRGSCSQTRNLVGIAFPIRFGKLWSHLYGNALTTILPSAAKELKNVEVDWLRVKPVVKVIGEFWAQMTESDGNFRMLEFLEKEGAEVSIEPIGTWLLYMLHEQKGARNMPPQDGPLLRTMDKSRSSNRSTGCLAW